MKPALWLPSSCALILILTGCASNKAPEPGSVGYGPFDSAGNYRDEWADDPTKWRKPGSREKFQAPADDLPAIAKNEQPPADANPLAPQSSPPVTKVTNKTSPRVESTPRESTSRQTVKRTEEPKKVVAKSKPKPTVAKAKSKPKPKSSRYVVKSGDSLSRIASRNGSSVSAIQKANGISGTLIHPGQSLVIPKR